MNLQERPYQLFFPLALFGAFTLSLPWVVVLPLVQQTWPGVFSAFPRSFHIETALQVFLLPAVTGFLLTAWPRIHGAAALPNLPVIVIFAAELAGAVLIFAGAPPWALPISLLALFAAGTHFFLRGTARPVFSICIVAGIGGGLAGSIWRLFEPGAGTGIVAYGMMPLLIGGAGGMLVIPMSDFPRKPEWKARLDSVPRWLVWCLSLLFLAGAAVGSFGIWIQAALSVLCGWRFLHLNELKWFKSVQARLFFAGATSIITGFVCMALFPAYRVHMAHLLLVSGLSSAIAAVMVQVILSHGGYVMRPIPGRKALIATGVLLALAALTRVSAALIPAMYLSHLSYAAMTFGAAWAVWALAFAGKMRQQDSK